MKKLLAFLPILLVSCYLFKDYKKTDFVYNQNGQAVSVPLLVPRGYVKHEKADTAGISLQTFRYADGAILYAAYLTDTTYELQSFNKRLHQPLINRSGALVYKGQSANELFYREIRQGNFRFGYRNVPLINESFFDSATNYASLQNR